LLLNKFFPIVDTCLSCEDIARQICGMVPRWRFFASFLRPVFFSEPRAAHYRPTFKIRTKATPCVEVPLRLGEEKEEERSRMKLECGPMPNVMVALPNTGGALCSTSQSLADAHNYRCRAVTLPRRETRWNLQGCLKLPDGSQPLVGRSSPYYGDVWRTYRCLTTFFHLSIRAKI